MHSRACSPLAFAENSNSIGFNQRKMIKNTFFSLQGGVKQLDEKKSTLNIRRESKTSNLSKRIACNTRTTYCPGNTTSEISKMSCYTEA